MEQEQNSQAQELQLAKRAQQAMLAAENDIRKTLEDAPAPGEETAP